MSSTQPLHRPGIERPLIVLSLDAGGVRTVSTISMVWRLMEEFNKPRPPYAKLEPYDLFDLIGGVETGGLLAIMLGSLKIKPYDCGPKFMGLCEKIYQPKGPNQGGQEPADPTHKPSKFNSEVLVKAIQDLCGEIPGADGHTLRNNYIHSKVCVVLNRIDISDWNILSSYPRIDDKMNKDLPDCTTWEVAAATTASPGLFDPQRLSKWAEKTGTYSPSDKVTGPLNFVAKEIKEHFSGRDVLLITIGSGVKARTTTGTLTSVDDIFENNPGLIKKSMLLSINNDDNMPMRDIPKDNPNKWAEMERAVDAYMSKPGTNQIFADCAKQLNLAYPVWT